MPSPHAPQSYCTKPQVQNQKLEHKTKPKSKATKHSPYMKTNMCIPRFRTNAAACGRRNRHISQVSMLDRLREAVFRLIMLSALSKDSSTQQTDSGYEYHRAEANCYHPPQPHHSEAVADCIEFFKKSATLEDGRNSTVSNSSSGGEVIFPVPVI